ncbi:diguanylate cyclase domain-containing protein [Salibacterium sp. K-3]
MTELVILYFLLAGLIFYFAVETFLKNKNSPFHKATSLLLLSISLLFVIYCLKGVVPDHAVRDIIVFVEFPLYVVKTCIMVEWFRILANPSLSLMDMWKRWGIYVPFLLLIPLFPLDHALIQSVYHYTYVHYIEFGPLIYVFGAFFLSYSGYIFVILRKYREKPRKGNYSLHYLQAGFTLFFVWIILFGYISRMMDWFQQLPLMFIYADLFLIAALILVIRKHDFLPAFEKRYEILFEESPIAIILINEYLQLKDVNKQAEYLFQREKQELLHESLKTYLPREVFFEFRERWRSATEESRGLRNYELSLFQETTGGEIHLVLDSQFIQLDNKLMQYVMIQDITAAKNNEREVTYLAYHDSMTGLYNRRYFQQKLESMLAGGQYLSLILMDLDNFKQINDTFGHHVGDEVICHAGSILSSVLPEKASAARLGGDEFAVILPETPGGKQPEMFARQFIEKMREPYRYETADLELSCSIGITKSGEPPGTSEQLLIEADRAMYEAKREGKSGYKNYHEKS